MAEHTPGPWEIERTGYSPDGFKLDRERFGRCWWVRTPRGGLEGSHAVALVDGTQQDADARLIARAPDMFEAISAFLAEHSAALGLRCQCARCLRFRAAILGIRDQADG
jgi:hypothetical protein